MEQWVAPGGQKGMKDKMFMVLWGITLFCMGWAIFMKFKVIALLEANHTLLNHIAEMHMGIK
jgi:hypothetical protein